MKKAIILIILSTIFIITPVVTLAFDPSYRFTDQELDPESGLYYFDAREYDPMTGRFLQQDPVLKDGEFNSYFLRSENQNKLQEILMDPQKLNPYSYARNNPIKYVDPTGESEVLAWILNPKLTAAQVTFWNGVANSYFKPQSDNISATFLQHSLGLRIGNNLDVKINQNNDDLNVINEIKQSNDYKNFISDRINEAKNSGLSEISFIGGAGSERKSIQFNSGDLSTSLGKVTNIYISGTQLDNGKWDLNIQLFDKYDFHFMDNYKNDILKTTGNNLAVFSQSQGAISNYNINIEFKEQW